MSLIASILRVAAQDVVDRVDPRRAVGELDVGEHHPRAVGAEELERLGMGSGDAGDAVPERGHHVLDVHGDQRLVLDDHDRGGHLPRDLLGGKGEKRLDLGRVAFEDRGDLGAREALHRAEQEGLAGLRRHGAEIGGGALFPGEGGGAGLDRDLQRRKEPREEAEEPDPVVRRLGKERDIRDQRLQHGGDIGVARGLRPGDRPREATQIRQMWRDAGGERHAVNSLVRHLGRRGFPSNAGSKK